QRTLPKLVEAQELIGSSGSSAKVITSVPSPEPARRRHPPQPGPTATTFPVPGRARVLNWTLPPFFVLPRSQVPISKARTAANYRIISASSQQLVRTLMALSAEVVTREIPEIVEFNKLKNRTAAAALAELVGDLGIVNVTALTRQGCSGC